MGKIVFMTSDLKQTISKINIGVEKNVLNPYSGLIELETTGNNVVTMKVSSVDYYMESIVPGVADCDDCYIHATVNADTFIGIVSKLDSKEIEAQIDNNALVFSTKSNQYVFPLIKTDGDLVTVERLELNADNIITGTIDCSSLVSVAEANAQGLVDATFKQEVQQFIYMDCGGALTYTNNIYINDFSVNSSGPFGILLNGAQAKLLRVFDKAENINLFIESFTDRTKNIRVKFESENPKVSLVLVTQNAEMVEKFPSSKIRELSTNINGVHAYISKSKLEKALNRLMVFDKKFGMDVMNYSKFIFGEHEVKLVSIKNHNFEIVPYEIEANTVEHEAIIRFADMLNQLKAIETQNIDISYGNGKAIIINSDIKQIIPELHPTKV